MVPIPMNERETEEGTDFTPRFDAGGLIPCVTISADSGDILMMAYMNAQALEKTLETGEMHYWSRSRNELWHKGATSGQVQTLVRLRTDCDQDTLVAEVKMTEEKSCHTGRKTCFYREVIHSKDGSGKVHLRFI